MFELTDFSIGLFIGGAGTLIVCAGLIYVAMWWDARHPNDPFFGFYG